MTETSKFNITFVYRQFHNTETQLQRCRSKQETQKSSKSQKQMNLEEM